MIDGKFAHFTVVNTEDTDMDSMITTFYTAVTETASETLGKHRQKKTSWITGEFLICATKGET